MRVKLSRYRPRYIAKGWKLRKEQLELAESYAYDKHEQQDLINRKMVEFIQKVDQFAAARYINARDKLVGPRNKFVSDKITEYLSEFRVWLLNRYPEAFYPDLNPYGPVTRKVYHENPR